MPLYSSQQQQRPWSITPLYLINTNAERGRWWPSVEDGCFVKDPAALWHDICVDLYGVEGWRELRSSPSIIHRCAEPQTDSLQWWSCCPPSHICLYGRARESSSFFFCPAAANTCASHACCRSNTTSSWVGGFSWAAEAGEEHHVQSWSWNRREEARRLLAEEEVLHLLVLWYRLAEHTLTDQQMY